MDYVLASYYAWQGEPVTREGWPEGDYACLKGASPHYFAKGVTPTVWHPTKEDRRATDYRKIHTGLCRGNRTPDAGESGDPSEMELEPSDGQG